MLRFRSIFFIASSLVAACSSAPTESVSSTEQPVIGDVSAMTACPSDGSDPACPAGSFSVTCKDGSTEVDTSQQVLGNKVCSPPPPPSTTPIPADQIGKCLVATGTCHLTSKHCGNYDEPASIYFRPLGTSVVLPLGLQSAVASGHSGSYEDGGIFANATAGSVCRAPAIFPSFALDVSSGYGSRSSDVSGPALRIAAAISAWADDGGVHFSYTMSDTSWCAREARCDADFAW